MKTFDLLDDGPVITQPQALPPQPAFPTVLTPESTAKYRQDFQNWQKQVDDINANNDKIIQGNNQNLQKSGEQVNRAANETTRNVDDVILAEQEKRNPGASTVVLPGSNPYVKDKQQLVGNGLRSETTRYDGSKKGKGWLGELKRPDGGVSTELTIDTEIDGVPMEIPQLVPGLTQQEVDYLLTTDGIDNNNPIQKSIIDKAISHAKKQLRSGKSVFAPEGYIPQTTAAPVVKETSETISPAKKPKEAKELLETYYLPEVPKPDVQAMIDAIPYIQETQGNEKSQQALEKIKQIINLSKPPTHEAERERLLRIARINSIGEGLATLFSGYMGMKGGPILNTVSDTTPKALAEYKALLEKDRENTYRNTLMQSQASIEAIRDQYKNELENVKYNRELRAKTIQAINKMNLDSYVNNEKARNRLAELLLKYNIDLEKEMLKNDFNWKKLQATLKNRITTQAMGDASRERAAANRQDAKNSSIQFINHSTGQPDEISPESATAIVQAAKNAIEKGKSQEELRDMAKTPGSEYNLISRFLTGGLNASEKEALMAMLYNSKNAVSTKQFSRNDLSKAYNRVYGDQETSTPSPTKVDVKKYGGKLGFGN